MLSNLLNLQGLTRSHPRQTTSYESTTEDAHTKALLFPEATHFPNAISSAFEASSPQSPGPGYDGIQGEIDLEHSRDIRIIIAQDEAGSTPRCALFDSKQSFPRADSSKTFSGRSARPYSVYNSKNAATPPATVQGHARRSSLVSDTSTSRSPASSAFQRIPSRASSISSMPNIDHLTSLNRRQSEADANIQSTCLDCMFGNISMGYKGTGNKLHIIPLEPRAIDQSIASYASEGQGSLPKGEARKRSNLATSYTPANPPPDMMNPRLSASPDQSSKERRRTVMVSRIFSVSLPDEVEAGDSTNVSTPTPQNSTSQGNAFPFSSSTGTGASTPGGYFRRSRAPKLPMYGVSIIMQLPIAPKPPKASSNVGSFPGHESLGSSVDSDQRGGWSWVDSSFGVDSLLSASFSSDVDDRVEIVGQHWDVLIRTLTSLQFIVQERVLAQFKATDASTVKTSQAPRMQRAVGREPLSQVAPRRSLRLQPYALAADQHIQAAVRAAGERVVRGMKIPRVSLGQSRWGIWRDEARWLGKWAGGKEENFFFFTLLTAFLGHHTEWLNVIGPKRYRRLHIQQQKSSAGEDLTISNRTVIVGPDKMAARRLIFLLSAFLPASGHAPSYDGASPIRPSTSASVRGYSQSPPHQMALARQKSLRRTINRRGRPSQTHSRHVATHRNVAQPSSGTSDDRSESIPFDAEYLRGHSRRPSEARSTISVQTSTLAFPPLSESPTGGKSSATITPTAAPDAPRPVPHFAMQRTNSSGLMNDVDSTSCESIASSNLMHNLRRTSHHERHPNLDTQSSGSKWSSIMSFWNGGRRSSSNDTSDILQSTDEGLGICGQPYRSPPDGRTLNKLEMMVLEADQVNQLSGTDYDNETNEEAVDDQASEEAVTISGIPSSGARDIPHRNKSVYEPLKLSINENDGVIDVDIPLPGFSGSPVRSPSIPSLNPGSFGGSSVHSSHGSFCHGDYEQPINVAGWLGKFHADFELQGVSPYANLEQDIRKAMSAEPTPVMAAITPNLESGPTEKWVDVCSALIADARSFTVKRLRLRRLVRLVPIPSQPAITPTPFAMAPPRLPFTDPYQISQTPPPVPMSELHLEEKFTEESVMDIDDTLADAIERVLAHSGASSRAQSQPSSRSGSVRGRKGATDVPTPPVVEIPRTECRDLVFGALEQIVKSVQEERTANNLATERRSRSAESTLREGIKRWLTEVE
ncbi:hypothetical protein EJ05DRAFT_479439 [Pseudovirgaria hyperparasitica]|uniref:Folliculin-interacting protein N-terminal domain-containing protein n=1 Tax=Pseudovirgaria hyperparasitica TaxID=470096 RepID=A0A6A6W071_9PEZI|nr:uncharacterized protein EJ05DRAFT_479439 [Pseudovirgaria hyperparasitica]KAF2754461.1 hypothetical protein EJ05DRAFT_479439 [Pseudovirgaria hyperparasitica]